MRVELLYVEGCPNFEQLRVDLPELLIGAGVDEEIEIRRVESVEHAERERFLGSPTVRVDGREVEPGAEGRRDYGLKCRLYRVDGKAIGAPPERWVVDAIVAGSETTGGARAAG
jgi:hypothetical protein